MLLSKFSHWPSFTQEEADAVSKVLLSNRVNYWTGQEGRDFEKEFAACCGTKYAVALANGTLALDVALKAFEIGSGDEVIVTSRTFIASVSSIVNAGAVPIFVDVCENSQNITPENISKAITPKTRAIMCVHLAGWPCEMDEISEIANEHNLFVIEDCAQAHGAKYKGRSVGSIGHVGCWSFCQDKIMSTGGEGGMVTTNDENLWKKMWAHKDHGKSFDAVYNKEHPPGFRWLHESFGTNWRMTEMQAAIGRIQLSRINKWNEVRNRYQNTIWETAKGLKGLVAPEFKCMSCFGCAKTNGCVHAAYKSYLFVEHKELKTGWSRDKIIEEVNARGIPCFSGSCSEVYLEKAFEGTSYRPKERLPVAKRLGESSLMFLVHPTLTENEIDLTCKVLTDVMHVAAVQ